jgi:hypothetical protein
VVAEKHAPEVEAVRDEPLDLAYVLVRSSSAIPAGRNIILEKFDPVTLPYLVIEERIARKEFPDR